VCPTTGASECEKVVIGVLMIVMTSTIYRNEVEIIFARYEGNIS